MYSFFFIHINQRRSLTTFLVIFVRVSFASSNLSDQQYNNIDPRLVRDPSVLLFMLCVQAENEAVDAFDSRVSFSSLLTPLRGYIVIDFQLV